MLVVITPLTQEEEMSRQTSVTFVDDLDGSKAVETVKFGLDGKTYEIDLNKKNAAALRKAVAAYVDNGRRIRSTTSSSKRSSRTATPSGESAAIREWAAANGIPVNARGRISSSIRGQYEATRS